MLGCNRFEQHQFDFFGGKGPVFNSAGDNDELTLVDDNGSVPKLHLQTAPKHQKHLVFIGMIVPNELALDLH